MKSVADAENTIRKIGKTNDNLGRKNRMECLSGRNQPVRYSKKNHSGMDVISGRLTGHNGYLHNWLEIRDDCGDDTGDDITSPGEDDSSDRHGGRYCIDFIGKYLQGKTDVAYILPESYLYFYIFYDSLYV